MNEFLDRIVFDNSIRMYLTIGAAILFIILIKRFVAHYLAGLLFQFITAIWKNIDKKTFTNLVTKPLGAFLVIFVSIITLHRLRFPEVLDVDIYRFTLKDFVH